ncbi:hypothetical protein [Methanotorris formicicus]|uniref:hypothetical protein n=1 Tax=Methanotorris formicicus TaxID=213185 RepID=UPI003A4DE4A9
MRLIEKLISERKKIIIEKIRTNLEDVGSQANEAVNELDNIVDDTTEGLPMT